MNKRGVSPRFSFNLKSIKKILAIIILVILWLVAICLLAKDAGGEKYTEHDRFWAQFASISVVNAKEVSNYYFPYIVAHSSILNEPDATREIVKTIIIAKAQEYHIEPDLLLRIAKCESGFNPEAKNPISTASGVFQFLDSTFIGQAKAYGMEWTDKNDARTQIELAAKMIADGGLHHWNASKDCWND